MKICKRCEELHRDILQPYLDEVEKARAWATGILTDRGIDIGVFPRPFDELAPLLEELIHTALRQATGYLTSDLAEAILRSPEARQKFATDYMDKLDYDLDKQGANLHRFRKKAGVKLWLAAAHLGMEKDILKAAENGKATLPATMLIKLARLYECTASDFIEGCLIEKKE